MNRMSIRYGWTWALGLLMLPLLTVLFVACSSDEAETVPCLNIYVYAPGKAAVTRGSVGASEVEEKVHNLQIWVFRSSDPSKKVASLTLTENELEDLNNDQSASYSIELSDPTFAHSPEPVDIYVLANQIGNNGTEYKDPISNSTDLDNAVFNGGKFFGFITDKKALTSIPDAGIPMSGVARGKRVDNTNNVLHIRDANVRLVRDVSKIRFVFSSLKGSTEQETLNYRLYIESITLDKKMMFEKEHFFLDGDHPYYWVENEFDEEVQLYAGDLDNSVIQNDDPTKYAYKSSITESEYEVKIDEWVNGTTESPDKKLTQLPVVYLPESSKRLSGKIKFKVGKNNAETKEATFSMVGSDFRRNQTWIVYAYYIGSTRLVVNSVQVTNWKDETPQDPHELHNW